METLIVLAELAAFLIASSLVALGITWLLLRWVFDGINRQIHEASSGGVALIRRARNAASIPQSK